MLFVWSEYGMPKLPKKPLNTQIDSLQNTKETMASAIYDSAPRAVDSLDEAAPTTPPPESSFPKTAPFIHILSGGSRTPQELELSEALVARQNQQATVLPLVSAERYHVEGEFARGGRGRVLKAEDLYLGRPVAIKEMLNTKGKGAQRFVREALFTARLQHPGVVPIYEAGCWPTGEPFYVMRLVSGQPLEDALQGQPDARGRLSLLPQLLAACEVMAYAHDKNIIHRDLKPGNIMVGAYGETVIIDWGLAKDLGEDSTEGEESEESLLRPALAAMRGDLTMVGGVVGTPAYMPPEQARGEPVDLRADVYALGAILYHLLAGRPPIIADNAIALLRKVMQEAPIDWELLAAAPPDLLAITKKALAPKSKDRYLSAKELASDLKRFTTGQLVAARSYSRGELLRRFLGRNRAVLSVLLVSLLGLTAVGVYSFQRVVREGQEAKSARGEARQKLAELYEEQGRQELLASQPQRALVYLSEAYTLGQESAALRFMLARAFDKSRVQGPSAGHNAAVKHVIYSSDGAQLVTSSMDGTAKLWSTKTGILIRTFSGHTGAIYGLAINPAGTLLATSGADRTARLWDLNSGRELRTFSGHAEKIWSVAFSSDGTRLVTASEDDTAKVWKVETGALLATLEGSREGIIPFGYRAGLVAASFSPDDTHLLTAGRRSVRLWDAASYEKISSFDGSEGSLRGASFSPDSTQLLFWGDDSKLQLLRFSTGEMLTFVGHNDWVSDVTFSSDGTQLISVSYDKTARVWNAEKGTLLHTLKGHRGFVKAVAAHPTQPQAATVSEDGVLRLWDLQTGNLLSACVGHSDWIDDVAFSPSGEFIATASDDHSARLWPQDCRRELTRLDGSAQRDAQGPPLLRNLLHNKAGIPWLDISHDGALVATSASDKVIRLWELSSGNMVGELHLEKLAAQVTFSPGDRMLATADSAAKTAQLWEVKSNSLLATLRGHSAEVITVEWSPDGSRVVTASGDATAKLWDLEGNLLHTLSGHTKGLYRAKFSPDGKRIVTTSTDGTARLWSAEGEELAVLKGHHLALLNLSLDAEGRIVTTSFDGTARLWSATGELLSVFEGHTNLVATAVFSSNASRLVTASLDRTARIWDTRGSAAPIVLEGNRHWLLNAVFSPNDEFVATVAEDGAVWLWDAQRGRLLYRYEGHSDYAPMVAFSPDGARLVTSSGDGSAKVWDARIESRSSSEVAQLARCASLWALEAGSLVLRPSSDADCTQNK
jgi:eukaryotic-like serine/threonine-protein kinase